MIEVLKQALEALETELSIDWTNNDEFNESAEKMYKAIAAIKEALAQPEQEPVGDDWTPCMKLPVVVYVRKQRLGESHVSTREGITPVKPDDLIMRGVSGEEYPIGRAIFERTYSLNTTPPHSDKEEIPKGVLLAITQSGLTLVKKQNGYELRKLGKISSAAQPEQEPSGHFLDFAYSDSIAYVHVYDQFRKGQQFYKAPPQRTWAGLTNEEIGDEYVRFEVSKGGFNRFEYAVRAIEAKLKEKNT